ncbi:MAG: small subunit ribosomal protein [Thermodesulfobacteriota bacterium]|nr:small subunit ribosomal protein [Thermodesulfobacteriota bacterium]
MARYRESVCRFCRRETTKLFLKGDRCFTDKCSVERRNYPPGQHGQSRAKHTDYGVQLREKQKVRRIYGILEKQFRNYVHLAEKRKGVTGENLLQLLESRLDNMVYRMGFAASRSEARQLVNHGHFLVNGRRVDVASFRTKAGMVIEVDEKSRTINSIEESLKTVTRRGIPAWVEVDVSNFKGVIKALPAREDLPPTIREQLIVEFYSK